MVTSLEEGVLTVASLGSPKPEVAEPISGWLRETNSVLVKMHRSRWKFRHSLREARKAELRRRRLNRRLRTKLQALSMTFDARKSLDSSMLIFAAEAIDPGTRRRNA